MAVKIGDLSKTETWGGGFSLLPEGTYVVRVVDASEGTSSNNNPQIIVDLEVINGDQKGQTLKDWITVTEKSLGRVKGILAALRYEIPEGDFELPSSALIGRTASVVIRHEDYINKDNEHKVSAKIKVWEEAPEGFAPAPGAPVSAAQKTDDDIPFRFREHTPDRVHSYNPYV